MGTEIDRLEIQIEAQAQKANKQMDELISKLGKMAGSMSGINVGGILAIGTSAKKSNNHMKNLTKSLVNYSTAVMKATYGSRSLTSTLSSMYSNAMRLARGFRNISKAAEKSMDYIETYNYYNVIMSKISSEFSNQWEQYGYASGEAYAESFSGRLNNLTQKMSGYSVGADGVLSITGGKNLSIDPEQIMSYQANVSAVTNSVGLMGETSINAAKALSMLAADMSSLKNIDLSTVMTNFQSGLIGQSRALYKYGIDITNATLQTYAYKYGLETAVSEMTQADKMQLRLLAILDQSKVTWGDQANTINSVANQYRILKQQISNAARVIGNLFIPVLQAVLPVVNGILIAFQKLVVFIGSLFGIDYSKIMDGISGGYSGADDSIGDLLDDTDSLGDSTGDVVDNTDGIGDSLDAANNKAKKLYRTLLGFDQINKLNGVTDDPSSNSGINTGNGIGAGSIGGGAGIDLSDAIAKALADYESIWEKALQNSQNKAQEYADKICRVFENMWNMLKSGDYEGLGEYIAGGVNSVLEKINSVFNWGKMGPTITKFVDGYTRTVNSLVDNIDWDLMGKTIGDGINVLTNTLYLYLTGIDWVSLGSALATGVNGMVNSIDWEVLGRTIGAWIMKIPKIAYGFVTTLNWGELGMSIGESLNGALAEIDLGMIGATIGTLLTGVFSLITNAATEFKWDDFGKNIANGINSFFRNFDGKTVAEGINAVINGILTTFTTVIREVDWGTVISGIGEVLANLDWGTIATIWLAGKFAELATGMVSIFGTKIKEILGTVGKNLMSRIVLPAIGSAFSSIGSAIMGGFKALAGVLGVSTGALVAVAAIAVAGIIAVLCNWDEVKTFFTETLPTWWNETVVPWIQGLPEFFTELPGKIYEKIITLKEKFVEWASGIIETVTTEVPKIIDKIVEFFLGLPEKVGYAIGFVIGKVIEWNANLYTTVATEVPKIIEKVVTFFRELPDKIWGAIIGAVDKVLEWNAKLYSTVSEEIPKIVNKVIEFFDELPGKIREIGANIIRGFIGGIKSLWDTGVNEVKDFAGGILDGIKAALDINSPSRETYSIGENVVAGMANAISDKSDIAMNAIERLGSGIKDSLDGSLSNIESSTSRTMSNLDRSFSDAESNASASASNIVSAFNNLHIPLPHLSVGWDNWSIGDLTFSVPNFDINWYANGGFPGTGELFFARESGPEMVGRMGGRSAVANNDQIVDGIAAGVYDAVVAAMRAVGGAGSQGSQAPIIELTIQEDSETTYKRMLKGKEKHDRRFSAVVKR